MDKVIKYRHNAVSVSSPEAFAGIRGGLHHDCRDVYFVRMLGFRDSLPGEIRRMDRKMNEEMTKGRLYYKRIYSLPGLSAPEDTAYYADCYEQWRKMPEHGIQTKVSGRNGYGGLPRQLAAACRQLLEIYRKNRPSATDSIQKNFAAKLLYWFDYVFDGTDRWEEQSCIKIVAENVVREQEYLFYYLLTLAGCDVLLLQSREDITAAGAYQELSKKTVIGNFSSGKLPKPEKNTETRSNTGINVNTNTNADATTKHSVSAPVVVKIPERRQKQKTAAEQAGQPCNRTKSFEELALLASCVVMIAVHGSHGDVLATGSGIMVGAGGYILTNDHVARGGCSYSVRIENDDTVYHTDEVIKYHSVLDLALLRIQRRLTPIPVYQGEKKLVRGQAVVAIGSPLGLFNSVSDGIISGFRTIDGVDMIQFTAPISSGSSGGAVLNMQGEVIGISTAGFDRGQNINLAVGYESINMFIQGFRS